jgi:hypothetical protein
MRGNPAGGVHHFVLPPDDIFGANLIHPHSSEVRKDFCVDDMLLCQPGIEFESAFHIGSVDLYETRERHIERSISF